MQLRYKINIYFRISFFAKGFSLQLGSGSSWCSPRASVFCSWHWRWSCLLLFFWRWWAFFSSPLRGCFRAWRFWCSLLTVISWCILLALWLSRWLLADRILFGFWLFFCWVRWSYLHRLWTRRGCLRWRVLFWVWGWRRWDRWLVCWLFLYLFFVRIRWGWWGCRFLLFLWIFPDTFWCSLFLFSFSNVFHWVCWLSCLFRIFYGDRWLLATWVGHRSFWRWSLICWVCLFLWRCLLL